MQAGWIELGTLKEVEAVGVGDAGNKLSSGGDADGKLVSAFNVLIG